MGFLLRRQLLGFTREIGLGFPGGFASGRGGGGQFAFRRAGWAEQLAERCAEQFVLCILFRRGQPGAGVFQDGPEFLLSRRADAITPLATREVLHFRDCVLAGLLKPVLGSLSR